jgi:hypothetical protein
MVFLLSCACLAGGIGAQSAESAIAGPSLSTSAPSPFLVAPTIPLGYAPSSVAAGDLRQSGKLDLVTADNTSGNITVFLGAGKGKFSPGVEYAAGPHPGAVLVADINGDGKPDVVVSNESEGTISVLLGKGDGTLQARQSYKVGFNPSFIATGDFEGAGKVDVAVAGASGNLLAILLNDGRGNLQKPVMRLLSKAPTALAVADFNNDGHADLAIANADGTVSILLGKGAGQFRSLPDVSVAAGSLSSIESGDFNKDGRSDLVVTEPGRKLVSVLLGQGDGTFASAVSYPAGNEPVSTVVAEVNGDSVPALVVINKSSNTFSILGGNGDGTFKPSVDFVAGNAPLAAVAGDFYGNGHVDLAIINHSSQTVSVPPGNGDGTFKAARSYSSGVQPMSVASGTLNGGKISALVVANYCGSDSTCSSAGSVAVFLADEKGDYRLSSTYSVGAGPVSVTLADVNGDRKLDIIALNRIDKTATVMLGLGDGTFRQPMTFPLAGAPLALAVGDLNKDGKLDLAVLEDCGSAKCSQPGTLEVLLGAGDGSFRSAQTYPVGYSPNSVAVGDINGDKNLDLVVANRCGNDASCHSAGTASVLLGDGTGRFAPGTDVALGNGPASIALGKLTGSGLDLVVSRSNDNTVAVLRGNGDGTFKAGVPYSVGNQPGSLVVADFNGDGRPDVAVTNGKDSTVSVLLGKGDGTLQPAASLPVGSGPVALASVGNAATRHAGLATANGASVAAGGSGSGNGSGTPGTEVSVLPNQQSDPPLASFTLVPSPAPDSNVNEGVMLTATLTGVAPNAAPSGNVTFDSDPGTGPVALSDCTSVLITQGTPPSLVSTAVCTTMMLTGGSDSLTAVYSGDGTYDTGVGETSPAVVQTVSPLAATLGLSSPGASSVNASVTFTAQLNGATLTPVVPSGVVAFAADGTTITGCGAVAVNATGAATCSTSALTASGSPHAITATYSGDPNFTVAAQGTWNQTVNALAATIGLTSPGASSVNTSVTFTAQLAGAALTPTVPSGNVAFAADGTTIAGCGAVAVNASGAATCSTSALNASGSPHAITATYSGDPNFTVAAQGTWSQTVNPLAATIGVTSPGASSVNTSVTFTAQLAGAALTPTIPTGKVAFTANGTTITGCGAVAVNASGAATCSTSSLAAPSDAIAATYSADPNFTVAAQGTWTQTVNSVAATLGLTSPGPSSVNASVTFTATLGGATFTPVLPSGNVAFSATIAGKNTTLCGSVAVALVAGNWQATCSTTALVTPSDAIKASYSGDVNFTVATAATMTQMVNATAATLSLTSPGASNVDASVIFTATLGGATFTPVLPSGNVAFTATIGNTPTTLCNSVAVALVAGNWQATCSTNLLIAPSDAIQAAYSGDTNFTVATAATLTQTVNPLPTSVTVTAAPSSSVNVGTTVTFTATVGASSVSPIAPSGSVTFLINGVTSPDCPNPVPVNGSQQATCKTASLVYPSDRIDATYNANNSDPNFTTSTTTFYETVTKNSSGAVVSLQSNPVSPDVNQTATLTATVTATSGTVVPTGTVTFMQGGTTLCSAVSLTVNKTNATAICNYAFTAAVNGSSLAANYSGDSNFGSGSGGLSETVNASPTATTMSSNPSSSTVNQTVAFTAVVAPMYSGSTIPTGKVVFTNTSTATVLCTETLAGNGTVPVCNYIFATAPVGGTYNVTAAYTSGDTNFSNSTSSTFVQTVSKTGTTTTVKSSSPAGSSVNATVTFTATVTPAVTGPTNPGGTVDFTYVLNGGAPVTMCATAGVTTNSGTTTASCAYALPTDGSYTVTATYSGDPNFTSGTAGTVVQSVGLTSTTTTFIASTTSPTVNQSVTFTATVGYPNGSTSPTGTVTFSYANGTVNLCAPVMVVTPNGKPTTASCTTTFPAAATDQVVATYSGDTNFASSPSSATAIVVGKTGTTTAVSGAPSPSTVNQTVTFTAMITPGVVPFAGSTNPGGSVLFTYVLNGAPAVTMCGAAAVNTVAGATSATCTVTLPTAGSYAVTAAYSGDTNFMASSNAKAVTQLVNQTATTVSSIVPSVSSPTVNQAVAFTATVTPAVTPFSGSTNPTGTITFSYVLNNVTTVMCSGAAYAVSTSGTITTAICPYALPSQGAYTIEAVYNGDPNFSASPLFSTPLTVAGTATKTTVTASPSPSSVDQPVTFTATVTPTVTGSTAFIGSMTFTYALNGVPQGNLPCTKLGQPVPQPIAVTTTYVSGVATAATAACNASLLQAATTPYIITATYGADTNYGSSSGTVSQTVNPATLGLAVTAVPATQGVNLPVTFTATLTPPNSGTQPTSTVTFTDALTKQTLCTDVAVSNLTANCPLTITREWTAGTHPITATYNSGDPNFPQQTSPFLEFVVTPVSSTTTITASPSLSVATQQVTFTATVTPSSTGQVPPSGYFNFTSNGVWNPVSCGAVQVVANGNGTAYATCTATFPATAETQTITAIYCGATLPTAAACTGGKGDPDFTNSSSTFAQTVQNFIIANSVTSALNPTSTLGPVTLTQGYSTATNSAAGTDPFNPTKVQSVVTSMGGFTDLLNITCTVTNASTNELVTDPSCTIAATEAGATGTALTYQLSASASAPIGAYTVTLSADDNANPALSKATTLTAYVVGVANVLSLAQGASGTESANFNTFTAPANANLVSFTCGTVWDLNTKAQLSASQIAGLTCTGPSSVTVTGVNTAASITISTNSTTALLRGSSNVSLAAFLGIPLFALMGWVGSRKSPRKNFFRFLGLILLLVGVSYASGCGGSFTSTSKSTNTGIGPGSYLVQVVGTDQNGNKYYAAIPLDVSSN